MLWPTIVSFALVSLCLARVYQATNQESFSSCPSSFSQVGDKCLLVGGGWKNWFEGDRYCRTLNAGMLSIRNQTEFSSLINSYLPEFAAYELELWTSGNSLGDAQTNYFWQSTGKEATYLPWATGEPKKANGECLSLTANFSMETGEVVLDEHRLTVRNCSLWGTVICETQVTQFKTELCLNPNAFHEAQIPV